MLRTITILYFVMLSSSHFYGQGSANIWYFGTNAGLDFSNGFPEVLFDSEMATLEGCATISNDFGELLFYTDGLNAYNRNHQVMQNGTGLGGDFSSSQSALIVPKPGTENCYYIFTVDADGGPNGLQYSEVNMDLDNGLGAITNTKNVLLFTPATEQLTATKINQQDAYWVLGHKLNSNEYLAYNVNALGVNPNPVISAIGSEVTIDNNIGQMKFSHQRNRLAAARSYEVQIFDFNNLTGVLSNLLSLDFSDNFYGVEFSPNGEVLYSSHFDSGFFLGGGVRQFYLYSNDAEQISFSSIDLVFEENALFGSLQLAPDGKIYIARVDDNSLDVIENPDVAGLDCNYITQAINLQNNTSIFGLPTFIQPYIDATFEICPGEVIYFHSQIIGDLDSLIWDFGDGNTSVEVNPSHTYSSPGTYEVTLTVMLAGQFITESKTVTVLNESIVYSADFVQCDDEISDGFTTFYLSNYNEFLYEVVDVRNLQSNVVTFYEDSNYINDINSESYINTSNPQVIYAIIEVPETGCFYDVEVNLSVADELLDNINIDQCIDSSLNGITSFDLSMATNQILNSTTTNLTIVYYETYSDAIDQESSLADIFTNNIPYGQIIYARAENGGVCYGIYPVNLNAYDIPDVIEQEDLYICTDSVLEILTLDNGVTSGNAEDYTYNWSTGEVTQQVQVSEPGTYTVTISTEQGCTVERIINVLPSSVANIQNIEITGNPNNSVVYVSVSGDGNYMFALDDEYGSYQSSQAFNNVSPGIHTVFVKDIKGDCGVISETFSVLGYPNFFTPNSDSINDTWHLLGNVQEFRVSAVVEIFNRYGKLLAILDDNNPNWDGKYNGALLPTDDYWFVAKLADGRTFKGHFTLKN
ncbi:T9SS type B sorting domain-containing protein [Winogradskyella sp. MIT101101]|uniref:T9SS type B sorting domain-containing protein n=1 Tax=Winogradskyella sp. MIT101101 TaxID=3098297 RepID=UPI00399AAA54